ADTDAAAAAAAADAADDDDDDDADDDDAAAGGILMCAELAELTELADAAVASAGFDTFADSCTSASADGSSAFDGSGTGSALNSDSSPTNLTSFASRGNLFLSLSRRQQNIVLPSNGNWMLTQINATTYIS
ncbi:MAG TPA: hypothetical protein V6C97_12655, partial [Oculatellaceae cyanobacterium]